MPAPTALDLEDLRRELPALAAQLGFNAIGVSGIDLAADEARLLEWLAAGRHGRMHYMERHGTLRSRPAELLPGTLRVISARMDYWPGDAADAETTLHSPSLGYVSRYALGRDYHKVLRGALQTLAGQIVERVGAFGYRVFSDSAPVLEKALARNARLGWIGKHTNLIARDGGSYFFLGEIYTDLPLPIDTPAAKPASRLARPARSSPPGNSTRDAASRISRSSWTGRSRRSCVRCSATGSTVATTASSSAPGTSSRAARRTRT